MLLVLDGLLVLIFLVAWAEASVDKNYRFSLFRWLRAALVPLVFSWIFHLVAFGWLKLSEQSFPKQSDSSV